MKKQNWFTLLLVICLLVGSFGAVSAQTVEPPETEDEELTEGELFTHPVLSVLAAYFGRDLGTETEDDGTVPDNGTLPEEDDLTVEEEIAGFHRDGMGFGVLVKLYAMAEASKLVCDAENNAGGGTPTEGETVEACVPLTAAELVAAFKGGMGMGQLFKEHGKPALLGVGHVKKALNNLDTLPTLEKGKPDKVKSNNGNGKKK